ncbi:helix-turn-helix transcriptional regulator [Streptomyces sp. NPDC005728]|uniref:helix-turn-helix domain-containing protein n=1 Tax=Streptomyces sp. NPDC005728 TaxID=3157054 RepID=UPI0033CC73E4
MARTASPVAAALRWTPWQIRAGWLLRAHRLHHADRGLRHLPGFARAYREGHPGTCGISPSSLSRWENGLVPVTAEAVRRYESVLGLAPYRLLGPVQTLARHEGGPAAAAFLAGSPPPAGATGLDRADALLDSVLDGGVLTGDDWDDLTRWAAYEGGRVSPSRIRHAVCDRLLQEMLVSDGVAWMRRFEALGRLLADPFWSAEAVGVCAGVAEQAEHAGLIETVCALDGSPHPDASRAVLRQLTDPTTPDSFYGALLAGERKTRKRHLTAAQTATLIDVVDAVLGSGPRGAPSLPAVEAAAVLLHRLPLGRAHAARLADVCADRPTPHAILTHGALTDPAAASVVVARVLAHLPTGDVPARSVAVLGGVLDDLLHHPVADVRLYAAILLRASPYGPGVARALAEELRQSATVRAEQRAIPMLHALRVLGGPEQRAVVAGLTLARGLPPGVVSAAVHALGHIGGRSPESYWRAVFRHHAPDAREATAVPGTADSDGVLKRLIYGFAMAGELDLLTRLVAEHAQALPAQRLSAWWTSLARHIRDSALR